LMDMTLENSSLELIVEFSHHQEVWHIKHFIYWHSSKHFFWHCRQKISSMYKFLHFFSVEAHLSSWTVLWCLSSNNIFFTLFAFTWQCTWK
jgi:hypothetical protein